MKATFGGKDAQGSKINRARNSDFKITNNNFKVFKELSLVIWGEKKFSPFLILINLWIKTNFYHSRRNLWMRRSSCKINQGDFMTTSQPFIQNRFQDKTVIVTGAGAGIGKSCVHRLVKEGAKIIASDWNESRLSELKSQLKDYAVITVAGDISKQTTTDAVVKACEGKIDVVINNAGIMDAFLPVGEVDDETWDRVLAVNLTGPMRLIRAALPIMLKAGKGNFVNISSEAGLRGACAGAAYTTSKHALIGLSRNTSFMYSAKGIRCNVIAPGGVKTSIEAPYKSALANDRLSPVFQGISPNMAEPEQLAASILWLASDDSSNITGAVLANDGGWSAI